MKKVKQIIKQNSRAGYSLHNNIESEAKSGVPGGIRTHGPLLRRHFLKLVFVNKFTEWPLKVFRNSSLS